MKSQILIVFENAHGFRSTQLQKHIFTEKQLLELLQREICRLEQNCRNFEIQYKKFVDYHQNLMKSVVA